MYKVIGPDNKEYPADLPTLEAWARAGNIAANTPLVDMNTGQRLQAGQLLPLQPLFGMVQNHAPAPAVVPPYGRQQQGAVLSEQARTRPDRATEKPPLPVGRWVAALVALIVCLGAGSLFVLRSLKAAQEARAQGAAARLTRIKQTMRNLARQYPAARFAFYPEQSSTVTFNAPLTKAQVKTVRFERAGESMRVDVGLLGIRPEATDPKVFVSLFDERGRQLGRAAIVDFVVANLNRGEMRQVEDVMTLPAGTAPVIVAVDEGGEVYKASASAPSFAPTSAQIQQNLAQSAQREAAAAQKFAADQAEFLRRMQSVPDVGTILVSTQRGINGDDLKITVGQTWHYQPFQVRLQLAQTLWRIWAKIHAPSTPDQAYISLVDANGNSVGGSSSMAGSLVHVDK